MRHASVRCSVRSVSSWGLRGAFAWAAALALGIGFGSAAAPLQAQIVRNQVSINTLPGPGYFNALNVYYAGDYKEALNLFEREWRGAFKIGQTRYIDSICYHTMMGECYYQVGNYRAALDQYGYALGMYSDYSNWYMRAQFPATLSPAGAGQVRVAPWGTSTRRPAYAHYPDKFAVMQGQVNNTQQAQQGGVVQQAQSYPVVVQEITRCTIQAIRRRRELLGPTALYDPALTNAVAKLSGAVAPGGSWCQAWVDVELGCAMAAVGKDVQARTLLTRALLAGGQYDHPLTGYALLELGRMELSAGKFAEAIGYFHEASVSSFQYLDVCVLEEAFRMAQIAHILANKPGQHPPVGVAQAWARANDWDQLYVSTSLSLAEGFARDGNLAAAEQALMLVKQNTARSRTSLGKTTSRFHFLTAWTKYQGKQIAAGDAAFAAMLAAPAALWQFQIELVDKLFLKDGRLTPREANEIYAKVLREPTPADWLSDPLESVVHLCTPHHGSFDVWLRLVIDRKEFDVALEVSDLAKRHRFLVGAPMGGRLLSLTWILEAPEGALPPEARTEKQDLLAAAPAYAKLSEQTRDLLEKVEQIGLPEADAPPPPELSGVWNKLLDSIAHQEAVLRDVAMRRLHSTCVFPPRRPAKEIQASLGANQAVYVFHSSMNRLYCFQVSAKEVSFWEVKAAAQVAEKLNRYLREMGHTERSRAVTAATFAKEGAVNQLAGELHEMLLVAGRTDLRGEYDDLTIVPDGSLWHLPFEALRVGKADDAVYLVQKAKVRYAPTAGLAVPYNLGQPKFSRSYLVSGQLHTQEAPEAQGEFVEMLRKDLPDLKVLPRKTPVSPSAVLASIANRLIVLEDTPSAEGNPPKWYPVPANRGQAGGDLDSWMALPWKGPEQIILPAASTTAAGGAAKGPAALPGAEIFHNICGLLASGSRTIVMSRWKTAGKTSVDVVREFARESETIPPVDAFQRSLLLAVEGQLDPAREPRVQPSTGGEPPPASHPFFWSGMMLVDVGRSRDSSAPAADPAEVVKLREKQKLLEELKRQEEERKKKEQEQGKAAN